MADAFLFLCAVFIYSFAFKFDSAHETSSATEQLVAGLARVCSFACVCVCECVGEAALAERIFVQFR